MMLYRREKLPYFSYLFLVLTCLQFTALLSQTPGGAGTTNLRGWYSGQSGITLTSGAVSAWNDLGPVAQHGTQTNSGRRPVPNTTGFNYNQTIQFDGSNDRVDLPTPIMPSTVTAITAFVVARQTGTGQDNWGSPLICQSDAASWTSGGFGLTALASNNQTFGFWVRAWNVNFVSTATTLSIATVMGGSWNGISSNNVQYYHSGSLIGSDGYTPGSVGNSGPSTIGSSGNDSYCFYGDIAEVIIYATGLSSSLFNRIQTYLALKYGVTLTSNYENTSGTTVFTVASPYTQNIIGIGRDDNTGLYQKQSKTVSDSTRIYISSIASSNSGNTGTFSSNNQFVVIADNGLRASSIYSSTEKPGTVQRRIEREWKVTNTGFSGTFNLNIYLNNISGAGGVVASDLRLLVDDDGNFSNATAYSNADGITISYSNPVITITGIPTSMIPSNSTRYITIGSISTGVSSLPIQLKSFTAENAVDGVRLNWETLSEHNNHYFTIERSKDGAEWEFVGKVDGAGNSNGLLNYSLLDLAAYKGVSYYRISQTDFDGRYEVKSTIDIVREDEHSLFLYPNPACEKFEIATESIPQTIEILDAEGALVLKSENQPSINIQNLKEGVYLVIITDASGRTQKRKLVIHH